MRILIMKSQTKVFNLLRDWLIREVSLKTSIGMFSHFSHNFEITIDWPTRPVSSYTYLYRYFKININNSMLWIILCQSFIIACYSSFPLLLKSKIREPWTVHTSSSDPLSLLPLTLLAFLPILHHSHPQLPCPPQSKLKKKEAAKFLINSTAITPPSILLSPKNATRPLMIATLGQLWTKKRGIRARSIRRGVHLRGGNFRTTDITASCALGIHPGSGIHALLRARIFTSAGIEIPGVSRARARADTSPFNARRERLKAVILALRACVRCAFDVLGFASFFFFFFLVEW